MTVYVDDAVHSFGRMIMCHLVAPDVDELHRMADTIGVQRKWFQDPRTMPKVSSPHYDIAKVKRALAVRAGAVEVDKYQMSVISKVALGRLYGKRIDPLRLFRHFDSDRLSALQAWLAAQIGPEAAARIEDWVAATPDAPMAWVSFTPAPAT